MLDKQRIVFNKPNNQGAVNSEKMEISATQRETMDTTALERRLGEINTHIEALMQEKKQIESLLRKSDGLYHMPGLIEKINAYRDIETVKLLENVFIKIQNLAESDSKTREQVEVFSDRVRNFEMKNTAATDEPTIGEALYQVGIAFYSMMDRVENDEKTERTMAALYGSALSSLVTEGKHMSIVTPYMGDIFDSDKMINVDGMRRIKDERSMHCVGWGVRGKTGYIRRIPMKAFRSNIG